MASRKVQHEPAPGHVIDALRTGGVVDLGALLDWYQRRCPRWLKLTGCAPDVAALLSALPEPAEWAHAQMVGR